MLVLLTLAMSGVSPGTKAGLLAMLLFSFGFLRMTGSLMYTQIKEGMPVRMAGTAMTGINFFTMLGPAIFLHGLGALMQTLYPAVSRGQEAFAVAFFLCAACLAGISILYAFTQDTGP